MTYDYNELYTFVSTGDKTAMYTLRVMCFVKHSEGHYMKDYYIRNLSTDKEKANVAARFFSEQMGLPLKSDAHFDLNEIKRRKSEEIEQARLHQERIEQERIEKQRIENLEKIEENVFLIGKYTGETPHEVAAAGDVQYIQWLANQAQDVNDNYFDKFNISAIIAKKWVEENPLPESEFVGEVGVKSTFKVRINYVRCVQSFRSVTYLFHMSDENGNVLKTFSTAKSMMDAPENEWITIQATVKQHDNCPYENKKVTMLKRPKVI